MVATKTPKTTKKARTKRWLIPLATVGAIGLAMGGALLWFFSGEAPAEVDLAATASSFVAESDSGSVADTADDSATDGSATAIQGTWTVDASVGEFSVEDATTSTFVGFRVEEVLNSIGSTTAVGRTPDVSGTVTIEGTTLTSAQITADLTSIVSDEARRQDSIQRALNTSANPTATFVLSQPIDLGEAAADGAVVSVTAIGDLNISGVTNEVQIDLDAQLIDGMVLVTGTTDVAFGDYGVTAPTSSLVLSVEDHGILEIQLWLTR